MVLALSLADNDPESMLWLDSQYPSTADPSQTGVTRGPCSPDVGAEPVGVDDPTPSVVYSNIRWGDLNSTYTGTVITAASGGPISSIGY
jgi:cellulose 1,4-beta-cellobiosidase